MGEVEAELARGQSLVEAEVAGQVADAPPDRDVAARVSAEDLDATLRRTDQVEDQPDRRRLAGAVGAEEAEHLAGADLEVEIDDAALAAVEPWSACQRERRRSWRGLRQLERRPELVKGVASDRLRPPWRQLELGGKLAVRPRRPAEAPLSAHDLPLPQRQRLEGGVQQLSLLVLERLEPRVARCRVGDHAFEGRAVGQDRFVERDRRELGRARLEHRGD